MKKIIFLLLAIVLSCQKTEGQKDYDTISKEHVKKNVYNTNANKKFVTYYTLGKDTILMKTEKYNYLKKPLEKDEEHITSVKQKKKIEVSPSHFIYLSDRNEIFFLKNESNKYHFVGSIEAEIDVYEVDGIRAVDIYRTSNIERHIKNNYLVIFTSEGNYKVGIFQFTEKGIQKVFLSKGCLFYQEWYGWDGFYEIKEGRIFLNYLIDPYRDDIGQVELKYENGKYSLDLDQCE